MGSIHDGEITAARFTSKRKRERQIMRRLVLPFSPPAAPKAGGLDRPARSEAVFELSAHESTLRR